MSEERQALENLLEENRVFEPPAAFAANSNATKDTYEVAERDWLGFWQTQAMERITWFKEPTVVLDDSNPQKNNLDRHRQLVSCSRMW